jgi:hypothetical protein
VPEIPNPKLYLDEPRHMIDQDGFFRNIYVRGVAAVTGKQVVDSGLSKGAGPLDRQERYQSLLRASAINLLWEMRAQIDQAISDIEDEEPDDG